MSEPLSRTGLDSPESRPVARALFKTVLGWFLLLAVIEILIGPLAESHYGDVLCEWQSRGVAGFLRLLGEEAVSQDGTVSTPEFFVQTVWSSLGVEPLLFLIGLSAFFPGKVRLRAIWIPILPFLMILFLNLRLVSLLLIGGYSPWLGDWIQKTWKPVNLAFFLFLWSMFLWAQWKAVQESEPRPQAPHP